VSPDKTQRLILDTAISPIPSRLLSLNLEILHPDLKKTVHSDLGDQKEGGGRRV